MIDIIKGKLSAIEQEQHITILYACESGSRAWGFASPDSDYDVRFIYARRVHDYLSITDRRDVIELPVNEVLDIGGWDIKKALQLFLKSNAPLYEWLQSPIIYKSDSSLRKELTGLASDYFSNRAGCHHYLSMAFNTFENDLQKEEVKLKKYFYALRPALACLWIIDRQTIPPMQFDKLRTLVSGTQWQETVDKLLNQKKLSDEKALIAPVPLLQDWIQQTLAYCKEKSVDLPAVKHTAAELDALFRKYITNHDI